MPDYRRAFVPGGTFFFTLVTEGRVPLFAEIVNRRLLHEALLDSALRRPFILDAIVLLHEHLHMVVTLPPGDADFSMRLASLKANFTHAYLSEGGIEAPRSVSRQTRRNRGVWQRRFWEHVVRDEADLVRHLDYVHCNPVKHGVAMCPHEWAPSSFHRFAAQKWYENDWLCACGGRHPDAPDFSDLAGVEMD